MDALQPSSISKWNHICMISDDNYALYTGIALTSLKVNKKDTSKYIVYILSDNIREENENRLLSLQDNGMIIHILPARGYEEYRQKAKINRDNSFKISATSTSLYKFSIPEVLKDLDSVLYVDGDVLFYKDIWELFDYDLSDHYAVVTPENLPNDDIAENSKRIGINNRVYFNSGLMLMNLKKFRDDGIIDKLIEYRLNGTNVMMDQDAFNAVIGNNVLYYPPYYFTACYELAYKENFIKYEEYNKKSIIKKTIIMHFATPKKPWKIHIPVFTREYLYYHSRSPFKDISIDVDKHTYSKRMIKKYKMKIKKFFK